MVYKVREFHYQIVAIKKESTWKWIRTKHVINRMGWREQENYYRIKLSRDYCSPLTQKSLINCLGPFRYGLGEFYKGQASQPGHG